MDDDELSNKIARDFWSLSVQHSDKKLYEDYKEFLVRINAKDEKFAVTCLLKISSLIDAYVWQVTNKSNS